MGNKVRIVQADKNYELIVTKDGTDETIALVYNQMDALLISYMVDKALNSGVDEEELKEYILRVAKDTPFIDIPED